MDLSRDALDADLPRLAEAKLGWSQSRAQKATRAMIREALALHCQQQQAAPSSRESEHSSPSSSSGLLLDAPRRAVLRPSGSGAAKTPILPMRPLATIPESAAATASSDLCPGKRQMPAPVTLEALERSKFDQKTEDARRRWSNWLDQARAILTTEADSDFDHLFVPRCRALVRDRLALEVNRDTQNLCAIFYDDLCRKTLRPRLVSDQLRGERQLQKLAMMRRFEDPSVEHGVRQSQAAIQALLRDMPF